MAKAKFRMVHTSFWNDPHVSEEMTVEDKYFFLYLLTNEHTTQIGIYTITKKQMAFELGYSIESVNALMQRFIEHHKLIRYNTETRELAVKNWGKYNLQRGGKPMLDCVKSELKQVKDMSLVQFVAERIENPSIKALYDTLTIRGQEKEKEEEQEEEQEQQQEKENPASPSSPGVVGPSVIDQNYKMLQEHCKTNMFCRDLEYKENRELEDLLDEFTDAQLIKAAIDITIENNKAFLGYTRGILSRWKADGITNHQQLAQMGGKSNGSSTGSNGSSNGRTPEEDAILSKLKNYNSADYR